MKVGTIGSGFIVRYILERIAGISGIECEAVYSRVEETGKKLAEEFGVRKVYTDLDEMYRDDAIDFIYVASPNSLHYEQVKKALQCGKHVICEKPFTPYAAQAEELIRMAKEKRLFLFEAITTLYHPNYQWIRAHVKELGELKMISCTYCQYSSRYDLLKKGKVTNVFDPDFAGGTLMDINVYNLHFVVGLLGAPEQVEYFAGRHENGVDVHGMLILRYGDVICQCTSAKDAWCEDQVQIMGENGYICMKSNSRDCKYVTLNHKGTYEQAAEEGDDPWLCELREFVKIVERKDYDLCYNNLDNSLEVVRILEKCR